MGLRPARRLGRAVAALTAGVLLASLSPLPDGSSMVLASVPREAVVQPDARVTGGDAVAVAVAASRRGWVRSGEIVLAGADNHPVTAVAAALAADRGVPLLLSVRPVLPAVVGAEIRRLGARTVWAVGDGGSITPAVVRGLGKLEVGVRRVHAGSAVDVAARAAEQFARPARGESVVVVGGRRSPTSASYDQRQPLAAPALAAAALTGLADRLPLLMAEGGQLSPATRRALQAAAARRPAGQARHRVHVLDSTVRASARRPVEDQLRALGLEPVPLGTGPVHNASRAAADLVLSRNPAEHRLLVAPITGHAQAAVAAALAPRERGVAVVVPPRDLTQAPGLDRWLRSNAHRLRGVTVVGSASQVAPRVVAQVQRALREGLPAPSTPTPGPTAGPPTASPTASSTPIPAPTLSPPPGTPPLGGTPGPSPSSTPTRSPSLTPAPTSNAGNGGAPGPTASPAPSSPPPTATPVPTATTTPAQTATPAPTTTSSAPPAQRLDDSVASSVSASLERLYSGPDPVQIGAQREVFAPHRIGALAGDVHGRDGGPLSGVRVSVLQRPEFGHTLTGGNGTYDLAVNGGGVLTVEFKKDGFITAQRQAVVPWNQHVVVDRVVLVEQDPIVNEIAFGDAAPATLALGSESSDGDGTRRAGVFFPPGTTATMRLPGGGTAPLSTGGLRITEFTVGPDGPEAMPGPLPPASAYTYAAEFAFDEATAAGARHVDFGQAVYGYLTDFLGMRAGDAVPNGSYDRDRAVWVAEANGRVVEIMAESDGLAELDVDGVEAADGTRTADTGPLLDQLGVTAVELRYLAETFAPGQVLWRSPMTHFSPYDWNHSLLPDAIPDPDVPDPEGFGPGTDSKGKDEQSSDDCDKGGFSVIRCENQVLTESLALAGTPYSLHYASDRVPGPAGESVDLRLVGAQMDEGLDTVEVTTTVLSARAEDGTVNLDRAVLPARSNLVHTVQWDGLDGAGQPWIGKAHLSVEVTYRYKVRVTYAYFGGIDVPAPLWARVAQERLTPDSTRDARPGPGRLPLERTRTFTVPLNVPGGPRTGQVPGGWSLDVHHRYDPSSQTVHLGDGTSYGAGSAGAPVQLTPHATLLAPGRSSGIAVAPDGTVYVARPEARAVERVALDGTVTRFAGNGTDGPSGDGGPALEAGIGNVQDLALDANGTLLLVDAVSDRVRAIAPDGSISTLAGGGTLAGAQADGSPASQAVLDTPLRVDVGLDGSVYVMESKDVRRIGNDGTIATVLAGLHGSSIGVGQNGDLHWSTGENRRTGVLHGDGTRGGTMRVAFDHLAPMPDGSVLGTRGTALYRYRDGDVTPTLIAGIPSGTDQCGGDDPMIALRATLCAVSGVGVLPDGDPVVVADGRLYRMESAFPRALDGTTVIPSRDGDEVYEFDLQGRHLRTLDALTGGARHVFRYNASGRLVGAVDAGGRETVLERTAAGDLSAVVAPDGSRTTTTTDEHGWLETVTDPQQRTVRLAYGVGGLLTSLVEPSGAEHAFGYDAGGLLVRDVGPEGGVLTLERLRTAQGRTVTLVDAAGRSTVYESLDLPDGTRRRTVTLPHGGRIVSDQRPDGTSETTDLDGSVLRVEQAPDPRFGLASPYLARIVLTRPDGTTGERRHVRSTVLDDERDPMSLRSWSSSTTTDGAGASATYERSANGGGELRVIGEGGSVLRTRVDVLGRVVEQQQDGLAAVLTSYDALGRLARKVHGDRASTVSYEGRSTRVASITDALGNTRRYGYDGAGRVTSFAKPEGGVTRYGYDQDGRMTTVTMPEGQVHRLGWDGDDLRTSYDSPVDGAFAFGSDRMRARTSSARPDGTRQQWRRGSTGRVDEVLELAADGTSSGRTALTWAEGQEVLESMSRTGAGEASSIDLQLDRGQLQGMTVSGAASGTFSYGYDARARLSSIALDGVTAPVEMDDAGLVTRFGPLVLTRAADAGDVTRVTDGTAVLDLEYDDLGASRRRALTVLGTPVYEQLLDHDAAGRIVSRTDRIGDESTTTTYGYDGDGRLTLVQPEGAADQRWTYDGNGRRAGLAHDDDDRVVTGSTYDANGALRSRGGTTYRHSGTGELLEAVLADGRTVTYAYDALGRRVARTERASGEATGTTTTYLYGNPLDVLQVTASRSAEVTTRYWYDEEQRLVALDVDGVRRYVATDHLGTPQVITDEQGGILHRPTWTAHGRPLGVGGNRLPLEIGFAGGLHDPVTGLVHLGMRDYDPSVGQWTSRDRALFAGRQANLYAYAGNDPVNHVDRTGMASVEVGAGAGPYVGIKMAVDGQGFSFCWELGIGIGAGIEADPFEGTDDEGFSAVSEVAAEVGGVGIAGKVERTFGGPCPQTKGEVKACAGPACVKYNGEALGTGLSVAELAGVQAQAKVTGKYCSAGTW